MITVKIRNKDKPISFKLDPHYSEDIRQLRKMLIENFTKNLKNVEVKGIIIIDQSNMIVAKKNEPKKLDPIIYASSNI